MKAASLQGEAGNPGLMMASSNLVKSVVNVARLLVGKSWSEYKQTDKMLKEARQVNLQVFLASLMCLCICKCVHMVSAIMGAAYRFRMQNELALLVVTALQHVSLVRHLCTSPHAVKHTIVCLLTEHAT